ncbi:MAG: hypothetical protein J6W13_08930 [Salinivirgaceae bacterium]|nr:hypothetical protein [Salinivirgaceae bacterium]
MNLRLVYTAISLLVCASSFAQVKGGHNQKLAKLYNSGKYEICLFKAEDMCEDPAASREAEPHLYAAMCMVKLYESPDAEVAADYKDGMRQAIKYTQKFIRKDVEGELYAQNLDFINELKKHVKAEIKTNFDKGNYTKAAAAAKNYEKLNQKTDYLFMYYSGILKCMSNNVTQGEHEMSEARTKLTEQIVNGGTIKPDPIVKSMIVDGIMKYTQDLVADKRKKDAEAVITLANKIFPSDGYITVQYNMIMGNNQKK